MRKCTVGSWYTTFGHIHGWDANDEINNLYNATNHRCPMLPPSSEFSLKLKRFPGHPQEMIWDTKHYCSS